MTDPLDPATERGLRRRLFELVRADLALNNDPADVVAATDPQTVAEMFADMIRSLQPAWRDHAACRNHPTAMFFPGRGRIRDVDDAIAVCETCPVTDDCLAFTLSRSEEADIGIYGGTSGRTRRQLRRQRSQGRR